MVIVRLYGGLGNQMFQYAAARAVAHRLGTVVKLDLSWFEAEEHRRYGLSAFRIWEHLASRAEIDDVRGRTFSRAERAGLVLARALRSRRAARALSGTGRVIKERHFHFDPELTAAVGDLYIDGYWQSPRYFEGIRELILREFDVRYAQCAEDCTLFDEISNSNSVAVHVRRGDYVSNSLTQQVHGLCTPDYYREAIQLVARRVEDPAFFFFSDDPEWVAKNIPMPGRATIVEGDPRRFDYDDLRLMAACAHHIIANSTFSWWGAWLAKRPSQHVVAPKQWFRKEACTDDLFPRAWHVL
jgi:hypothetical protein